MNDLVLLKLRQSVGMFASKNLKVLDLVSKLVVIVTCVVNSLLILKIYILQAFEILDSGY